MDSSTVVTLLKDLFLTTLAIATPILVAGLVTGLAISIFQTVTSISEQTMTMVPKMLIVAAVILYTMPWIITKLTDYARPLLGDLASFVR